MLSKEFHGLVHQRAGVSEQCVRVSEQYVRRNEIFVALFILLFCSISNLPSLTKPSSALHPVNQLSPALRQRPVVTTILHPEGGL